MKTVKDIVNEINTANVCSPHYVEDVISNELDLVEIVTKLKPLAVVKG